MLGLALYGCRATDETAVAGVAEARLAPSEAAQEIGSLYLPLVTPDAVKYRLRSAVFAVERAGVTIASLDSELEPDAQALTAS